MKCFITVRSADEENEIPQNNVREVRSLGPLAHKADTLSSELPLPVPQDI